MLIDPRAKRHTARRCKHSALPIRCMPQRCCAPAAPRCMHQAKSPPSHQSPLGGGLPPAQMLYTRKPVMQRLVKNMAKGPVKSIGPNTGAGTSIIFHFSPADQHKLGLRKAHWRQRTLSTRSSDAPNQNVGTHVVNDVGSTRCALPESTRLGHYEIIDLSSHTLEAHPTCMRCTKTRWLRAMLAAHC